MGLPAFFLNGARAVHRDKDATTFKLKDGHTLKVAHAPLKPEHREAMMKLPVQKMADGGDVGPDIPKDWLVNQAPAAPTPSLADTASDAAKSLFSEGTDPFAKPAPPQPPAPDTSAAPPSAQAVATPQPQTPGIPGLDNDYAKTALAQGQKGVALKEKADIAEAANQSNIRAKQLVAQDDITQGIQQNLKDFTEQHQKLMGDLANNKINPNHYMESMNTAQRVSTAIGLFLGGWSTAYTHGSNPALEFLNKQIERDIQAQQSNQDNRKTLLGANEALYKDKQVALNMTRAALADHVATQIEKAAADQGTPRAQAAAMMARSNLQATYGPAIQSAALRAAVVHGMSNGTLQQMDPSQQIRLQEMSGIMPAADAKAATDSLGKIQSVEKLRQEVEDNARDLNSKFLAGALQPGYRDAKIQNLAGILAKTAEGRFNLEESKNQMAAMMPGALTMHGTREAQEQGRKQFFDALRSEHEAALKKYNISVPHLPLKDPNEGRTGTLPNGQRIMVKDGRPVPIK